MRVEIAWLDDTDEDGPAELEAFLRQDPRLDDTSLRRARSAVEPGHLGANEILEVVATNVGLGLVANALWDYARTRLRRRETRLLLRRTDHADGTREVEIDFTGPPETAAQIVRDALGD